MKEKFVIKKFDLDLKDLKGELRKAKTIWISNATTDFLERIKDTFSEKAEMKVLLIPGEKKINVKNVKFKEADVEIVCVVRGREVPSISLILDEERVFTVFWDPMARNYIVDEMLYEDCTKCFLDWYSMSWNSIEEG